jgi:hypothetical protein
MLSLRKAALASAGLIGLGGTAAQAVHLDIELKGEGGGLAVGFCMTPGVGCDLPAALGRLGLPSGVLPRDRDSGEPIFAADFGDFPKPYDTANPGFHATDGALGAGELIRYRALGPLVYWDLAGKSWISPPAGTRIRLFGGLDAKTVITSDYSQCGGLLICIPAEKLETVYEEGSTTFFAEGVGGAESLLIDNANSQGAFHTHLDWFLENAGGAKGGPAGAYQVRLRLESDRRPEASAPFLIVFNNGLSDPDFAEAIAARMAAAPAPGPEPESPAPLSERGFLSLDYRENTAEKLVGCRRGCRKTLNSAVRTNVRVGLDGAADTDMIRSAAFVVLDLGTSSFRSGPVGGLAVNRRGWIKAPLTDGNGIPVGKLRLKWKRNRLVARFALASPVFSADFLEKGIGRRDRLETVGLKILGEDETVRLSARAALEIDGKVKDRQLTKGGKTYALGKVRLRSRGQTR